MTTGQRRTRDLVVIGLFAALVAFLFWPSGDDRDPDPAPESAAEVETPTPEPTGTPAEEARFPNCDDPDQSARLLNQWIAAMNNGDLERLAELLPERGAPSPTTTTFPGMDQAMLHSFTVHESGAMSSPSDVLAYLEDRHQTHGERWRIDGLEIQRLGRPPYVDGNELDRIEVRFARSAADLPDHEIHGVIMVSCHAQKILLLDLMTDEPDLALPIPVEAFLGAVGPYGTGEMRDLRMIVSTDLREDTGALMQWDIRRIEANDMTGSYVETATVDTMNGNRIIDYVYDGSRWYLDQRGWQEVGDLTGWSVLPLEIMMTRLEPSITANVLRDHLEDIPAEGSATFTAEWDIRDELRLAASLPPSAEAVEGIIEVEVQDGNLVRTSYRLVDRQQGIHSSVPEIRWLHIHRLERYVPTLFGRPPGFQPDEQQYMPAQNLDGQIELIERLDHQDGIGELFALEWEGEVYEVLIMPSRGLSHESTRGDDWPPTWDRQPIVAGGHRVILGGPPLDRFPRSAVWDTRQYRYDIRIDPDSLNDPDGWGIQVVNAMVQALLAAETSDGLRWIGPGN